MHSRGFTLLELSIVLVVIGLLAAGITVGAEMIRAAEIRSVASDLESYRSAMNTFRIKYMAVPGDMPNATEFWTAADADPTACKTTVSTGEETCNGNGDGRADMEGTSDDNHEQFRFWQHLANAGLIEGTFTGVAGSGYSEHHLVGINCPASRVSGVGYGTGYSNATPGSWFPTTLGPYFIVGMEDDMYSPFNPAFTTEEAYSIDLKMDDGRPGLGKLHTQRANTLPCATTNDPLTAEYDLDYEGLACSLTFLID